MKTRHGITPKQKVWADEYVANGGDHVAAAKLAYPDNNWPEKQGRRALESAAVQKYVERRLVQLKTPDLIIDKLIEKLEASDAFGNEVHNAQLNAVKQLREMLHLTPQSQKTEEKHLHIHLDSEPTEVLEWITRNGRMPNAEERLLLGGQLDD